MITGEMELNIDAKLNNTRNLLQELGNSVSTLVNSSPEIFEDPGIKSCLEGFLVDEQIERLKICLSEDSLDSSIDFEKAAISDLRKKLAQNMPTLPDKFFDISDTIKQNRSKQTEVVGQKAENVTRTKTEYESYTEYYQSGSCLKSTKSRTKSRPITRNYTESVTRDITADVEYIELFLPSPDLMAKQWLSGIEKGKGSLWDILLEWILKRLDYVSCIFEDSVNDITNLAERALEKQLSIIEENFDYEKQSLPARAMKLKFKASE